MKQITIILMVFSSLTLYAQKSLKKADKAYEKLEYYNAIDQYEKYLSGHEDVDARIKLADCYLNTNQYDEAVANYTILDRSNSLNNLRLKYGNVLLILGRVEDAKMQAEKYLAKNRDDESGLLLLKSCNQMDDFVSKENLYLIDKTDFSKGTSNYSPIYYDGKLFYTTDLGGKIDKWTGRSFSNIYMYDPMSNKSEPIKGNLNGKYHNGVLCFIDENRMMYTRNSEKKNKNNNYNLLLAEAVKENGKWEIDKYFKYNNEQSYNVAYPTISSDGSTLIFASDMGGGVGGWDLYSCKRKGNTWTEPVNLSNLNTAGNEMFPNISGDIFTFSSDGYPGMGGLDIFITDSSTSDIPVNIGAPFNSHTDDFGLITLDDLKSGYFCSNRNDHEGLDHIYKFSKNAQTLILTGIVLDEFTKIPLKETAVTLVNTVTGETKEVVTGIDGRFSFDVLSDQAYTLSGIKNNINTTEASVDLRDDESQGQDLYFTLLHNDPRFSLEGYAQNAKNQSGVKDVNVSRFNSSQNKNEIQVSAEDGFFKFQLEQDSDFEISGEKDGHYTSVSTASTKGLDRSKTLYVKLFLTMEEVIIGETKILGKEKIGGWSFDPIYYDLDKSNIRYDASIVLDKLADFLNQNPGLVIELGSHTDSRGNDKYNEDLSTRRAASAVSYLKSKGISSDRLQSKGYGEYTLVNHCANNVQCTEDEHQLNRRTEVKVLANR